MSKGSQVFTVMVVGEEPEELMSKYEINSTVEKYVKYRYLDAQKIHSNSIKIMEEIINNPKNFNLNSFHIDTMKERLKQLKDMSDFEYYQELTKGLYYDENGDAWSTENPNGKWQTFKLGKSFSLPLILKDGTETHQALFKDIDWHRMHMQNTYVYERIWDMVMLGQEPQTEQEHKLYDNMKDNVNYFNRFKDVDEYVVHNCAYWNYAYLDENGWKDMDDGKRDIDWISEYYNKFISVLKPNDKITIFECTKGKED